MKNKGSQINYFPFLPLQLISKTLRHQGVIAREWLVRAGIHLDALALFRMEMPLPLRHSISFSRYFSSSFTWLSFFFFYLSNHIIWEDKLQAESDWLSVLIWEESSWNQTVLSLIALCPKRVHWYISKSFQNYSKNVGQLMCSAILF